MKFRHIVPLVALLGLSGCRDDERQTLETSTLEESAEVEAPGEEDSTELPCRKVRPESRPHCYFPVRPDALESALGQLYTEGGRALAVAQIMDKLGFQGWVEATGGPLSGCGGDHVPVRQERIVAAIDHFRQAQEYHAALELMDDASSTTLDVITFGNGREIALEGARDASLSPSFRANMYKKASGWGPHSYQENLALAEEAVNFLVVGKIKGHEEMLDRLLPDSVGYCHDDGKKETLVIPPNIKARKAILLQKVWKVALIQKLESRHSGMASSDADSNPESEYSLRHDFLGDPCTSLKRLTKTGPLHVSQDTFAHALSDERTLSCGSSLVLRVYESAGDFLGAAVFAKSRRLDEQAAAYWTVVHAIDREYSLSVR